MNAITNIHQSSYGFHATDRETYKKLRKVRYYIHVNIRQEAAYWRWENKQPQNRVRWVRSGERFVNNSLPPQSVWSAQPWPKPEVCPINLHLLQTEYLKALPKKTAEEVKPLNLSGDVLDSLIEQAEAWLVRIGRDKR